MCGDKYTGPRIEVTILKTGAKHKITQSYLQLLADVSSRVTFSIERRSKLVDILLSYFSVIQGNGFIVFDDKFSTMDSGFIRYIPFVPVTDTDEKLWEFTFIFAVTNNASDCPDELFSMSDEEKKSIFKTIVVGSEECPHPIHAMYLLSDVCRKLKEL